MQENIYRALFEHVEKKPELTLTFPKCILLHLTKDLDALIEVSEDFVAEVGNGDVQLVTVEGVGHCFDDGLLLKDPGAEI